MSVFWSISFKMAAAQNVTEHMLTQKSIEVHCEWLYNKCHKINLLLLTHFTFCAKKLALDQGY